MKNRAEIIPQLNRSGRAILSLIFAGCLVDVCPVAADRLGDSLAGQLETEAKTEAGSARNGFTTRGGPGLRTRGVPTQTPLRTESQTIYTSRKVAEEMMRTRGVPIGIQIEDEAAVQEALQSNGAIKLKTTTVGASKTANKEGVGDLPAGYGEEVVAIEIKVDPDSKTAGQINFVKNKAVIKDDSSFLFLADLVDALTKDDRLKDQRFVIQGHASADGDVHHNLELSQKRADAIFAELVRRGVESNRIFAVGVGEQFARHGKNEPEQLRARDRRVILYRLEE